MALQPPRNPTRYRAMATEVIAGWKVFKQIFTEHWEGFKQCRPRYDTPYYDDLVDKMLRCGNPDQMGYIEYRCLHCGEGKHLVSMSCKSSLCLRCAKVYVDDWVAQVGKMLHEGVIYRHIVLTVPDADIEQVQNEKKPFTLRRIRDETTPHDSGEGHRWNRSESNA